MLYKIPSQHSNGLQVDLYKILYKILLFPVYLLWFNLISVFQRKNLKRVIFVVDKDSYLILKTSKSVNESLMKKEHFYVQNNPKEVAKNFR